VPVYTPVDDILPNVANEWPHVPPVAVTVKVILPPAHTVVGALIVPAAGSGFTVTAFTAIAVPHPLVTVYFTVSTPAVAPTYTPADDILPNVANAWPQVPPVAVSVKVILLPAHTVAGPLIAPAAGSGFTVTAFTAIAIPHTLVTVYFIVSTPAIVPEYVPVDDMLPKVANELPHAPPEDVSDKVILLPVHTVSGPVTMPATGGGFTVGVIVAVAIQPHAFVTLTEYVAAACRV
jgi:hypothetical protein